MKKLFLIFAFASICFSQPTITRLFDWSLDTIKINKMNIGPDKEVTISTYAQLSAFVTYWGSVNNVCLKILDVISITANYAIPSNYHLKIQGKGGFLISSACTLTVNNLDCDPNYQIFGGSGKVKFGTNAIKYVRTDWWGTNSISTLNNAIYSLQGQSKKLKISTNMTLLANDSIPYYADLDVEFGATISIAASCTLKVKVMTASPMTQIFAGDGQAIFDSNSVACVRPEWWGAKGNGLIDDASAINKAINAVYYNNGGEVLLRPATYLLATPIIPHGVGLHLCGASRYTTILKSTNTFTGDAVIRKVRDSLYAFNKHDDGIDGGYDMIIEKLQIQINRDSLYGIWLSKDYAYRGENNWNGNYTNCVFRDLYIVSNDINNTNVRGISLGGMWNNRIEDCRICLCEIGAYFGGAANNSNSVINCQFSGSRKCGIYTNSSSTIFISNNDIEACGSGITLADWCRGIGISNNYFEANAYDLSAILNTTAFGDVGAGTQVTNLSYINNRSSPGIAWTNACTCKVATTDSIALSGEQTIDGVSCVDGDTVLVKNQGIITGDFGSYADNGIYIVKSGAWVRTGQTIQSGTKVFCTSGTFSTNRTFVQQAWNVVVGTTDQIWEDRSLYIRLESQGFLQGDIKNNTWHGDTAYLSISNGNYIGIFSSILGYGANSNNRLNFASNYVINGSTNVLLDVPITSSNGLGTFSKHVAAGNEIIESGYTGLTVKHNSNLSILPYGTPNNGAFWWDSDTGKLVIHDTTDRTFIPGKITIGADTLRVYEYGDSNSFLPLKAGTIFQKITIVKPDSLTNDTLTAAQVASGAIWFQPPVGISKYLPSADSLLAKFPNAVIGSSFECTVMDLDTNSSMYDTLLSASNTTFYDGSLRYIQHHSHAATFLFIFTKVTAPATVSVIRKGY